VQAVLALLRARSVHAAAMLYGMIGVSMIAGSGWMESVQRKGDVPPTERAAKLAAALANVFTEDIAKHLSLMAMPVLFLTLTALAIAPLLATVVGLVRVPETAPLERAIAAAFVSAAVIVGVGSLAFAIADIVASGVLLWTDRLTALRGLSIATIAALPSIVLATLSRTLAPRSSLAGIAAFFAITIFRFSGLYLVAAWPPLRFVLPRAYELPLLSPDDGAGLTAIAATLAWSVALILAAQWIAGRRAPVLNTHAALLRGSQQTG
jgi:hypothetical protein